MIIKQHIKSDYVRGMRRIGWAFVLIWMVMLMFIDNNGASLY